MNHAKAAAILLAIVLIVIAFIGFSYILGVDEYWAGFLFLVSWAIIEQMQVSRLLAAIAGSVAGASLACLPALLTPVIGEPMAFGIMLALVLLAVYALLVGWLPTVINNNFMLFLNVLSIPHVVRLAQPFDVAKGITAGVVFFGGLALILVLFNKLRPHTKSSQP